LKPLWRRALPLVLVLLVVNVVAFAAYTMPRLIDERDSRAQTQALGKELEQLKLQTAADRDRADVISTNTSEMALLQTKWVTLPRLSILSLLAEIEDQARTHNLKVGGRGYTFKPAKGLSIGRFTATMPITGTYAHLAEFLRSLETSKYFVTVDRISIREQHEQRGAGAGASLDVEISSFYRQQEGLR
jgi:Tfp pilus assembly protein PilO